MKLEREQLEQMIALARTDSPKETCGIIGGREGHALQVYPLSNVDDQPTVRYLADPAQQLRALQDIDAHGGDVIGIYHSHPQSEAYPSETDIQRAYYPDATCIIISLMDPEQIRVRGFTIKEGHASEVTLEIEDQDNEPSRTSSRRNPRRTGRPRTGRAVATLSKRRPQSRDTGRPRR